MIPSSRQEPPTGGKEDRAHCRDIVLCFSGQDTIYSLSFILKNTAVLRTNNYQNYRLNQPIFLRLKYFLGDFTQDQQKRNHL